MSEKQKLARMRNFQLMRLTGLHIDTKYLTTEEWELVQRILNLRDALILGWDENSAKMGLVIKPHKCYHCGRRSYKEYLVQVEGSNKIINVCNTHFKMYEDATDTTSTGEV